VVAVDFRLVPDQTPEKVKERVETFLASRGWTILGDAPDLATRLTHTHLLRLAWEDPGYPALRTDMTSRAAKAVIDAAIAAAGRPVVLLPILGGSVPLYLFHDLFAVPVIGLPIVNHDDNQHAPNENLRLRNLWDGIETYATLMGTLKW
jgi:acetylornithine deacetylase/succinyl-diaminopimelate desuccinylase-like protein